MKTQQSHTTITHTHTHDNNKHSIYFAATIKNNKFYFHNWCRHKQPSCVLVPPPPVTASRPFTPPMPPTTHRTSDRPSQAQASELFEIFSRFIYTSPLLCCSAFSYFFGLASYCGWAGHKLLQPPSSIDGTTIVTIAIAIALAATANCRVVWLFRLMFLLPGASSLPVHKFN